MSIEPEIIPPPDKPKRRNVEYSDEIFEAICERMTGGEWLRQICDQDPQMPTRQTFLRWIEKDTGRQEKYARASRAMVDYWAEELLEIPKETKNDTIIDAKGRRRCNMEWVANKRLLSENIRFLMSKIYPKRYGDRVPEQEAERDLKISWQEQERADPVTQIRRIILSGPIVGDDGRIIDEKQALEARIKELEERLGMREGKPQPPKQLTYDPGPLPSRIDPEVLARFLRMIKGTVPHADQRPPETVLDEVLSECERALTEKYGKADAA
jgi:hypothetical protein